MHMPAKHNEEAFEKEIVAQMTASGDWFEGSNSKYDSTLCLYPEALIQFIQTTQLETWEALKKALGGDARSTFLSHVAKEITLRGTLAVLRNDVDLYGCRFRLVYFQPSSGRNPELEEEVQAERFDGCVKSNTAPPRRTPLIWCSSSTASPSSRQN